MSHEYKFTHQFLPFSLQPITSIILLCYLSRVFTFTTFFKLLFQTCLFLSTFLGVLQIYDDIQILILQVISSRKYLQGIKKFFQARKTQRTRPIDEYEGGAFVGMCAASKLPMFSEIWRNVGRSSGSIFQHSLIIS